MLDDLLWGVSFSITADACLGDLNIIWVWRAQKGAQSSSICINDLNTPARLIQQFSLVGRYDYFVPFSCSRMISGLLYSSLLQHPGNCVPLISGPELANQRMHDERRMVRQAVWLIWFSAVV